jgi:hypothetical protein
VLALYADSKVAQGRRLRGKVPIITGTMACPAQHRPPSSPWTWPLSVTSMSFYPKFQQHQQPVLCCASQLLPAPLTHTSPEGAASLPFLWPILTSMKIQRFSFPQPGLQGLEPRASQEDGLGGTPSLPGGVGKKCPSPVADQKHKDKAMCSQVGEVSAPARVRSVCIPSSPSDCLFSTAQQKLLLARAALF